MNLPQMIICVVYFLYSFSSEAQQTTSLQDCIHTGLERNYSLQITRHNQEISSNNYTLGNAGMLPTLDFRGQYSGTVNNSDQRPASGSVIQNRGIHNTTAFGGVTLNWGIFDGFRARTTYNKLAELDAMGELNTHLAIENLIAGIASEYFYYIQQLRLMSNLQFAVDLSKERVRIEEEHFLLGSGSKVRLLQSQVYLNADSSRLERQHEVLRSSRIRLNELMAIENLDRGFFPADSSIVVDPSLLYDDMLQSVMQSNTYLAIAAKNQNISEYDLNIIRSRSYPYLNLSSGYGFTRNTFQSGTFQNQQTWGMNYGLTLGINIFDGFNRKREISNAILHVKNTGLHYERIQQEIMGDLITIYNSYSNNLRLLQLETQNLEVARENLDIAFDRYRLGALSGFELREVQKNLLEAEERLLSIQYLSKMAEIGLLQLSGRIMDLI